MTWSEYVKRTMGSDQQNVAAEKAGVDQATVSRWVRVGAPGRAESVAAFARAYGRPVLEAFLAAGFLNAEEAGQAPAAEPDLNHLTNDEVLSLVRARMRDEGTAATGVVSREDDQAAQYAAIQEGLRNRAAATQGAAEDAPVRRRS